MRTIKFRGGTINGYGWVYGDYFKTPLTDEQTNSKPEDGWFFLTGKVRHCISENGCVYEVDPKTVGQFTGLKDKNGVEIYDGDIMKFPGEYILQAVVSYGNGSFSLYHQFGKWGLLSRLFELNNFTVEIIGNIHDNPNLINIHSKQNNS